VVLLPDSPTLKSAAAPHSPLCIEMRRILRDVLIADACLMQTKLFKALQRAAGESPATLDASKAPTRSKKDRGRAAAALREVDDDPVYDQVRREAAADARAQATERALTDEERAERERVRLQALEQARKRAGQGVDELNTAAEEAASLMAAKAMGGYAGRREVARLEVRSNLQCVHHKDRTRKDLLCCGACLLHCRATCIS
jgi:hypothetical protein